MRADRFFAVDPASTQPDAETEAALKALFDVPLPTVLMDAAADAARGGTAVCVTRITAEGQLEVEKLFFLDAPSLQALSHILRHRELWPEGFAWDYSECETCAMGLAHKLWRLRSQYTMAVGMHRLVSDDMAKQFAMPDISAQCIFGGRDLEDVYGVDNTVDVTPEMVADRIDQYLAVR
jgi:hypothetical protein